MPTFETPACPCERRGGPTLDAKETHMTTSQALRAERRAQRERMEREERMQTALGAIFLIALLAAFVVAGTMDAHDEQVYRESWHQIHGVD